MGDKEFSTRLPFVAKVGTGAVRFRERLMVQGCPFRAMCCG